MKTLFEPARVGGLALKNRLLRSATFERALDAQGDFLPVLAPIYEKLAQGGLGAIITGMFATDARARVTPSMVKAYDEAMLPQLTELARLVQARGCKLVVQLSHCGLKATPDDGSAPLGPSRWEVAEGKFAEAMSEEQIAATVRGFAQAAALCQKAGVDAVQIHGAHGYLLSQFLSPYYNKRQDAYGGPMLQDAYGGDISGRGRIVLEAYRAVRESVGKDFPVWVKINCKDLLEGGGSTADYFRICRELDRLGIDAIELSAGLGTGRASNPAQPVRDASEEGSYAAEAVELAALVKTDVISVGGYRSPAIMEEWLNKGGIKALSLSRPLIREPDLAARWAAGDASGAACISCNKCFRPKGAFGCQLLENN
ncbi:NADH:flavin oxidoreductase [Desulfovibrio sp. OttesenSCG-928-C14]|nr:NADH:flavin oxidoreductase [Desulfovibrio sp. OttesenSCG-928-C14]